MKTRGYKKVLITIFIILAIPMSVFTFIQIAQHKQQVAIQKQYIHQVVGAYNEGLSGESIASSILKGHIDEAQIDNGKTILKSYGFTDDYETVYDWDLQSYIWTAIITNIIIYILLLIGILVITAYIRSIFDKEQEVILDHLTRFHNGEYDVQLEIQSDNTTNQINNQLESLGKRLSLNEKRLTKENEETKSLVTDISHQLKTPIASLKMCFDLVMNEDLEPEEEKEFMQRSVDQIGNLEALIAALVNISRMETGMIIVKREAKSALETLIEAVNSVYIKTEEKNIEIELEGISDESKEKYILPHDVKWTKEAFINVMENGIKYSDEGSRIVIRMLKLTNFLRIEFEDSGIGVEPKEYNSIFKRFYRGSNAKVKATEGSGVGLYLTRKLLEDQGGNIMVRARKDHRGSIIGSTFILQLSLT